MSPTDPQASPQLPEHPKGGCLKMVLAFVLIIGVGALLAVGVPNLLQGKPFFGEAGPDPRQQVREAADEYFGESSVNSMYVTGASKLCSDLESGIPAETSLADAEPVVATFYTDIAVPILCPEYD